MHWLGQILEDGVIILRLILLHTRRGRSQGWAFPGTESSIIWRTPISQTVYNAAFVEPVLWAKIVDFKIRPPSKNFRGELGVGSGGLQIHTRGVYTPSREEFSRSTPKDLRRIWKLRKNWPATVVIFVGTCTQTLNGQPLKSEWSTLGYVNSKSFRAKRIPIQILFGVTGVQNFTKKLTKKFKSLGGSCPSTPKYIEICTPVSYGGLTLLRILIKTGFVSITGFPNSDTPRRPQKIMKISKNVHPSVTPRARVDFMCRI